MEGAAPANRVHSCHRAAQEEPGWPPGQEWVEHLRRAGIDWASRSHSPHHRHGVSYQHRVGNGTLLSSNGLQIQWGKFKHKARVMWLVPTSFSPITPIAFLPSLCTFPQLSTPPCAPAKLAYLQTCWAPSPPQGVHLCSPLPLKGPSLALVMASSFSSFWGRSLFPRESSQSTQSKSKHTPA